MMACAQRRQGNVVQVKRRSHTLAAMCRRARRLQASPPRGLAVQPRLRYVVRAAVVRRGCCVHPLYCCCCAVVVQPLATFTADITLEGIPQPGAPGNSDAGVFVCCDAIVSQALCLQGQTCLRHPSAFPLPHLAPCLQQPSWRHHMQCDRDCHSLVRESVCCSTVLQDLTLSLPHSRSWYASHGL